MTTTLTAVQLPDPVRSWRARWLTTTPRTCGRTSMVQGALCAMLLVTAGCDEQRASEKGHPGIRQHAKTEGNVSIGRHIQGNSSFDHVFSTPKVIRNRDYWKYFDRFAGTGWDIDFATNMVLYCFVQSTVGMPRTLRIVEISTNTANLQILVEVEVNQHFGPDTVPMVWNPQDDAMFFHLVEVPQYDGEIRFDIVHNGRHSRLGTFPPVSAEQEEKERRAKALDYASNLLTFVSAPLVDPAPRNWEQLIANLRNVYHPDAVPAVRKYVERGGLRGRLDLIWHLGYAGDEQAIPCLVRLLTNQVTRSDMHGAVKALGLIGPDKVVPTLAGLFGKVEDAATGDTVPLYPRGRSAFLDRLKSETGVDLRLYSQEFRTWETGPVDRFPLESVFAACAAKDYRPPRNAPADLEDRRAKTVAMGERAIPLLLPCLLDSNVVWIEHHEGGADEFGMPHVGYDIAHGCRDIAADTLARICRGGQLSKTTQDYIEAFLRTNLIENMPEARDYKDERANLASKHAFVLTAIGGAGCAVAPKGLLSCLDAYAKKGSTDGDWMWVSGRPLLAAACKAIAGVADSNAVAQVIQHAVRPLGKEYSGDFLNFMGATKSFAAPQVFLSLKDALATKRAFRSEEDFSQAQQLVAMFAVFPTMECVECLGWVFSYTDYPSRYLEGESKSIDFETAFKTKATSAMGIMLWNNRDQLTADGTLPRILQQLERTLNEEKKRIGVQKNPEVHSIPWSVDRLLEDIAALRQRFTRDQRPLP